MLNGKGSAPEATTAMNGAAQQPLTEEHAALPMNDGGQYNGLFFMNQE
jgi:hypothetical protein